MPLYLTGAGSGGNSSASRSWTNCSCWVAAQMLWFLSCALAICSVFTHTEVCRWLALELVRHTGPWLEFSLGALEGDTDCRCCFWGNAALWLEPFGKLFVPWLLLPDRLPALKAPVIRRGEWPRWLVRWRMPLEFALGGGDLLLESVFGGGDRLLLLRMGDLLDRGLRVDLRSLLLLVLLARFIFVLDGRCPSSGSLSSSMSTFSKRLSSEPLLSPSSSSSTSMSSIPISAAEVLVDLVDGG